MFGFIHSSWLNRGSSMLLRWLIIHSFLLLHKGILFSELLKLVKLFWDGRNQKHNCLCRGHEKTAREGRCCGVGAVFVGVCFGSNPLNSNYFTVGSLYPPCHHHPTHTPKKRVWGKITNFTRLVCWYSHLMSHWFTFSSVYLELLTLDYL